jgi:hypothetical protein
VTVRHAYALLSRLPAVVRGGQELHGRASTRTVVLVEQLALALIRRARSIPGRIAWRAAPRSEWSAAEMQGPLQRAPDARSTGRIGRGCGVGATLNVEPCEGGERR